MRASPTMGSTSYTLDSLGPTSPRSPNMHEYWVECLHSYTSDGHPSIKFAVGDKVHIVKTGTNGWICAEIEGQCVWLPESYTRRLWHDRRSEDADGDSNWSLWERRWDQSDDPGVTSDQSDQPLSSPEESSSSPSSQSGQLLESGSLDAFLDRLISLPIESQFYERLRHLLLISYSTFTTGDDLLDLLWHRLSSQVPIGEEQAKNKLLQSPSLARFGNAAAHPMPPPHSPSLRIFDIFISWIDEHDLLRDEPMAAATLRERLMELEWPNSYCPIEAKHPTLQKFLSRSQADLAGRGPQRTDPRVISRWREIARQSLFPVDPSDIAQQLTLYESKFYQRISARECIHWPDQSKRNSLNPLVSFCSNLEKIASWVKFEILDDDSMIGRGNLIDKWIGMAETCRSMNNLSSAFAIITALSSQVLQTLPVSWANASRQADFKRLQSLFNPKNGYKACRSALRRISGPCVPFIGVFLNQLVYIDQSMGRTITVPPYCTNTNEQAVIKFAKCQKSVEVVDLILRYQQWNYTLEEKSGPMGYVEDRLARQPKSEEWMWKRNMRLYAAEQTVE